MIPFLNVKRPRNFKWVIVPVPYEKTTTFIKGTSKAPEEILNATRYVELYDPKYKKEPYKEIGIETDLEWNKKEIALKDIEERVIFWLSKKKKVFLIGGEHTITLPSIKAYKKKFNEFGIVHLDAHSDLRYSYEKSKLNHACVFRRIFELNLPFLSAGVRALSKEEARFIEKKSIPVLFSHEFSLEKFKNLLKKLPNRIYVSFDCDFLDPKEVPSVGTPEPNGFSYGDLIKIIEIISQEKEVIGIDLVEACPRKGLEYSIYIIAQLIYDIFKVMNKFYAKN